MTNCRNCGARMDIDTADAVLRCRHCGSAREVPLPVPLEMGAETEMRCPACDARLAHGTFVGHPLLSCRACGGLLIEMAIFVSVVDSARALETRTGIVGPRQQQPGDRILACPRCQRPMLSHLYAGPGNIVIDTCEPCGVNWLDPTELRRIARAP